MLPGRAGDHGALSRIYPALGRMEHRARVHRTTIDVDLDAFEAAREALGTTGYQDTVNAALAAIGRQAALRDAASLIRARSFAAPTPDDVRRGRRERTPR